MPLEVKLKIGEGEKHAYDANALICHNGCVYSGADDGKIKCWTTSLKLKCEKQAHPCSIYSLAAIGDTIYSCSNDGTVKAWTLDLEERKTLITDECEFWKMATAQGTLYAGNDQGQVFAFENDVLLGNYVILDPVKDMAVDETDKFRIFTAKDSDLQITELGHHSSHTFVNRKTMPGRAPLCLVGQHLVFADQSAKGICLHANQNNYDYKHIASVKDAHEMIINCLIGMRKGADCYAISAGWDRIIKIWKVTDQAVTLSETCKVDIVVNALTVDDKGAIYAAGGDGLVIKVA